MEKQKIELKNQINLKRVYVQIKKSFSTAVIYILVRNIKTHKILYSIDVNDFPDLKRVFISNNINILEDKK